MKKFEKELTYAACWLWSTKFQHIFLNVKFWVKILGCHNVVVKWIHQTQIWTKHFCETRDAGCHWEVNRFKEWIQAFWRFLNQNWAFSRNTNTHHFHEFYTSCWYSVAKWLWKKPHVLWRKRCRYRFSLLCCQFPRQYRRFRHRRVWSLSHNINHIIYFSPTFFLRISFKTRKSNFAKQKLSI